MYTKNLFIIFLLCLSVFICSGCTNDSVIIGDNCGEKVPLSTYSDEDVIYNAANEYFYRVMDIGDNYNPAYIDENTEVVDMKYMVKSENIRCKVYEVNVYNIEFDNSTTAHSICILKANYSSNEIEKDEYYISFSVDYKHSQNGWTVTDAEMQKMAKTSEAEVAHNVNGEITFTKKGD